jgi:predicted nuclease of predicted toxin-antitoxin system
MADLYTNENFPLPAAEELRRLGHDVMTIQESGLGGQSITDEPVLKFAISQRRAIVTLNRRHFVRLHDESPSHTGIVVCTADKDFIALASRIDVAIRRTSCLDGRITRVNRGG